MKRIKIISILLVQALVFGGFSFAQKKPKGKEAEKGLVKSFNKQEKLDIKKEIKKANSYIETGEFDQALYHFKRALSIDSTDATINFKVGDCYMHTAYKDKALPYFLKAKAFNPTVDLEIDYLIGQGYQLNTQWDLATKSYQAFLKTLQGDDLKFKKPEVDKKIYECKNGKAFMAKPVKVKIENLGPNINTAQADYAPVISADESILLFTSRRPFKLPDFLGVVGFENVFQSENKDGKWQKAEQLGKNINVYGSNNSNISLSTDGQTMLIYKAPESTIEGDIYMSTLEGSDWTKPVSLGPVINSKHKETSASISFDGKTIYFVSDRPRDLPNGDKTTDKDIYQSTLVGGKWTEPVNLGKVINTPYDEEGVVLQPDGKTLYFSSRGHNSMGDFDIFKSKLVGGKWSKPENLGYPINGPSKDALFVISASGIHGYYASVKPEGYGETDIYRITWIDEENKAKADSIKPPTPQVTILKGTITDKDSGVPLEAELEIIDNATNKTVAKLKSNSASGKYLITLPSGKNYGITANRVEYLFHSENVNVPESKGYQEIVQDIALNKIVIGSKIILNNIFFDVSKATLRPESTNELERLTKVLSDNPQIRVEISGHTDSDGSLDYNQKLSEARSKSVVEYLIKAGIATDRLEFHGYGPTKPIAPNDTPENKQLNRRTEFEIIK